MAAHMTSVMYRMSGPPIHEQTPAPADAMLLRLLDGDESMGGNYSPTTRASTSC